MADAAVLNTAGSMLPCGFESHLRHQYHAQSSPSGLTVSQRSRRDTLHPLDAILEGAEKAGIVEVQFDGEGQ